MNDERIKILQLLQEGKISVDEASRLIEAAEQAAEETVVAEVAAPPQVAVVNVEPTVEPPPSAGATGRLPLKFVFGVNLGSARLDGADLEGAKLLFSNLDRADLRNVDLRDGWILGANLEGANFEGADLRGAVLAGANFEGADFRGADLRDAVLAAGNFERADFRGMSLRGRRLIGLNMERYRQGAAPAEVTPEG